MRVDWQKLWDKLYEDLGTKNSWGKDMIKDHMDKLEKEELRRISVGGGE